MSESDLLKQIATLDNLKLAFNYAKDGAKRFFIPDFFRHQDYTHSSEKLLKELGNKLLKRQYKPKVALEIEVPKSHLATRPGTILDFEDFVVLYAIINVLVDKIDQHLPDNVYSWRVIPKGNRKADRLFEDRDIPLLPIEQRKKIKEFEEWYEAWPAFDDKTKDYIFNKGYKFLATTDITSYFENINHDVLRATLMRCSGSEDPYPINLLIEIIGQWTVLPPHGNRIDRGIPQGNDVSSYLGNIYLIPLDEEFKKLEQLSDIRYLRYVDDVKILAKNKNDARKALFIFNRVLRQLHLNMQTSKTEICDSPELDSYIQDKRFEGISPLVEQLQKRIQKKNLTKKEHNEYEKGFKEHLKKIGYKLKSKDIRLFKRILTGLILLKSNIAVNRCFSVVVDIPALTDKIVRYFKVFKEGNRIPEQVLVFIKNKEEFPEYQIARLIEIYKYKNNPPHSLEEVLYKYAVDENLHWSIRTNSLIALSYFSLSSANMKKLWDLFNEELNHRVKKAMLLCFLNSDSEKRDTAIKQAIFDTDSRITFFAKFLNDILHDKRTQLYEIENLLRISPSMFVDESYKLLLIRESKDTEIINKLLTGLIKLKLSAYPFHIRGRIEETKKILQTNLTNRI